MSDDRIAASIRDRAHRNHTAVLKALASVGQKTAAELIGTSETTVSRFKDSGLEQAAALLAACGLKCVAISMRCYPPEYIDSLKVMAKLGLDTDAPQALDWE